MATHLLLPPGHLIALLRYPEGYPESGQPWWDFVEERGPMDRRPHGGHEDYADIHFTGTRCFELRGGPHRSQRAIFRLDDHVGSDYLEGDQQGRLAKGWMTATPWIPRAITWSSLRQAIKELVARNEWFDYIRLTVAGGGDVGVYDPGQPPRVHIRTRSFDPEKRPYYPAEVMQRGLVAMLTNERRGFPSPRTMAKLAANYVASNACEHEARTRGFDTGILLSWDGEHLSEFSVMNLGLIEDETLVTPDDSAAPLRGITMMTVGTIAEEIHGWRLRREPITLERLCQARAIFGTGSANGLLKVRGVVDADRRTRWELTDRQAEGMLDTLANDVWRAMYGQLAGFHPEWHTIVPTPQPEPAGV
ncbi:MAG: aminotransferase class IV [Candidatus Kerfeldbacteria bacterium]|nr:aminotransferase class IV [Candidatus Kerfeldbacteria bacterium]